LKKIVLAGIVILFLGCSGKNSVQTVKSEKTLPKAPVINMQVNCPKPVEKKVEKKQNEGCLLTDKTSGRCVLDLEAKGVGVVPCNGSCSTAQAKAMARRAAIVDAYKVLAEKMYGIQIKGRDTVKNMILENSTLRSYVYGLIRNAQIVDEEFKDGTYTVTLSIKLDPNAWNRYIENYPFSSFN